jgi:hypothetical protein
MEKNFINKITQSLTRNTELADLDSEMRLELVLMGNEEEEPILADRYYACAECPHLCEEFKVLGKTVLKQPQCGSCGCLVKSKIPLQMFDCPEGNW